MLVCSRVPAVNRARVLPAMYAVNIISSRKDHPSPTLDCLSLCSALSTFLPEIISLAGKALKAVSGGKGERDGRRGKVEVSVGRIGLRVENEVSAART